MQCKEIISKHAKLEVEKGRSVVNAVIKKPKST